MDAIYLDYAATCPMDARVLQAMQPLWACGNPASGHEAGQSADECVTTARTVVARSLGAQPEEMVFTSGATESDNWAIKGYADRVPHGSVITQATEHKAILRSLEVVGRKGLRTTVLPVNRDGVIDLDQLWSTVHPGALVSIMLVNNETGVIQPVSEIANICHDRGAWFHCDAAQGLGRIPLDVNDLGVHLLSLSAHKAYGPKGIGALYIRDGVELEPILHGGRQERGRRAGTTNAPLVSGFGEAILLSTQNLEDESQRVVDLCDRLIDGVLDQAPGAQVNGVGTERAPGIVNFAFPGADQEELLCGVGERLCCSAGSACGLDGPSHVMKAMGIPDAVLRVSVGRWTTLQNVERAAEQIVSAVRRAQRLVS